MEQFVQWLQERVRLLHPTQHSALRCYLASQLGYRNRNKALRRIDALLQYGQLGAELQDRLSALLQVSPELIDEQCRAARARHWRRQREIQFASQGPQLIAIVPRPTQLFFAGLISAHKCVVALPMDLPQRSDTDQLIFLRQAAESVVAKEGGSIPLFGGISGFGYVHSPHAHWLLDTQGQLVKQSEQPFYHGVVVCRLG